MIYFVFYMSMEVAKHAEVLKIGIYEFDHVKEALLERLSSVEPVLGKTEHVHRKEFEDNSRIAFDYELLCKEKEHYTQLRVYYTSARGENTFLSVLDERMVVAFFEDHKDKDSIFWQQLFENGYIPDSETGIDPIRAYVANYCRENQQKIYINNSLTEKLSIGSYKWDTDTVSTITYYCPNLDAPLKDQVLCISIRAYEESEGDAQSEETFTIHHEAGVFGAYMMTKLWSEEKIRDFFANLSNTEQL
jgi:hypothetical protein